MHDPSSDRSADQNYIKRYWFTLQNVSNDSYNLHKMIIKIMVFHMAYIFILIKISCVPRTQRNEMRIIGIWKNQYLFNYKYIFSRFNIDNLSRYELYDKCCKMNYYFLLIININIVFERISNQLEKAITNFIQKMSWNRIDNNRRYPDFFAMTRKFILYQ